MSENPTYEISQEGGVTRIEFNLSPSKAEMMALMEELASLEGSERRMYVMEKAEILLSTADVREGAEVARKKQSQPRRIVVVAPGSITYGISRIFKVFRESEDTELAIFRDEDAGREWLLSEAPAPED